MEQKPYYEYTLKQSSQFKKDLKSVKFDEHKLDELQKVLEHLGLTYKDKSLFLCQYQLLIVPLCQQKTRKEFRRCVQLR